MESLTLYAPAPLTLSWRKSLSYRNQSMDLLCKSMDWGLYNRNLRHERFKIKITLSLFPQITNVFFTSFRIQVPQEANTGHFIDPRPLCEIDLWAFVSIFAICCLISVRLIQVTEYPNSNPAKLNAYYN